MQKSDKAFFVKSFLIIFFLIFLSVYGYRVGVNAFFLLGIESYLPSISGYQGEKAYNSLLRTGGSGDTTSLLQEEMIKKAETLELLGDTLYVNQGNPLETIAYYSGALSLEKNKRVEEKMLLLGTSSAQQKEDAQSELHGSGGFTPHIDDAKNRIEKDAKSRGIYIRQDSFSIQNTLDAKIFFEERIDW